MVEALTNCTAEQHEHVEVLTAHHKYAPELIMKELGRLVERVFARLIDYAAQ